MIERVRVQPEEGANAKTGALTAKVWVARTRDRESHENGYWLLNVVKKVVQN